MVFRGTNNTASACTAATLSGTGIAVLCQMNYTSTVRGANMFLGTFFGTPHCLYVNEISKHTLCFFICSRAYACARGLACRARATLASSHAGGGAYVVCMPCLRLRHSFLCTLLFHSIWRKYFWALAGYQAASCDCVCPPVCLFRCPYHARLCKEFRCGWNARVCCDCWRAGRLQWPTNWCARLLFCFCPRLLVFGDPASVCTALLMHNSRQLM